MKLTGQPKPRWLLVLVLSSTFFLLLGGGRQLAQTQAPARTGHVNDLAGVLDETTRQRLETILTNLKIKTGIEFDIATVQTTGGEDIADFSLQLARDWNVGARTTPKKSLLLVVAVAEKTSFTRFSRSVQSDLPEGVLGEVALRMRTFIEAGQFGDGVNTGVQHFVKALSQKLAFNADELNETPAAVASATPGPTASKPTDEVGPAVVNTAKESGPAPVKVAAARKSPAPPRAKRPSNTADDAAESEQVESTLGLPLQERITTLKAFLESHPDSKSAPRATELLVSAHAALGDQRLKNHEAGGVEELMLAITEAPATVSEKLFSGVIAQIPMNLYLRGESAAAAQAAHDIEAKFGSDPKHLLALSAFYVRIEQGSEAVRLANQALQLAPDLAEAHQGLGLALHVSLRLDEAIAEYKRALELDPNAKSARRSLADLLRASGKFEDAVTLYRQQLESDTADKGARTGLILSLLDLGRTEEAKSELEKTLTADPKNLTLLAGAAYWFAAHNDNDLAVVLASRAVNIEPRYTWSQIALARGLVAQRKPLDAERALRFARQYGKFPTLEYELASVLMAASLYDEAAEVLSQSFTLKNGEIETRLGGQTVARNASFQDLLAPERRASIFQFTAADTDANSRLLKSLLKLSTALDGDANSGNINEEAAVAAAKEFASGDDAARVFRELYAANRLLLKGVGFQTAFELTEGARTSAEAGLGVPDLTVAVQAEEFRPIRARAIASGGTPDIPEAPRNVMSNLLRGRIEDTSGWARLNQDKLEEAVEHLKRAIAILPEGTPAAQTSLWRLGVALERQDKAADALTYYIKSYNTGEPDPARRAVVEKLYRKVNGSLNGLDEKIGPALPVATNQSATDTAVATAKPLETAPLVPPASAESSPGPTPAATTETTAPSPESTPDQGHTGVATPSTTPAATPTPEVSPNVTPEPTPSPQQTPAATPEQSSPAPTSAPEPVSTPAPPAETTGAPAVPGTLHGSTTAITGQIKDAEGNAIENVIVVLISPLGTVLTATTDAQGNFSFTVSFSSSSRNYRIIPSKEGFTFEPVDRVVPVASDDVNQLNFVGKAK